MAFTEFYLKTTGAATNGGSDTRDAGDSFSAVTNSSGTLTKTGIGANNAIGSLVGQWLCWDTASTKTLHRITSVTDNDNIVVSPAPAGTGLNLTIGGAWNTLTNAALRTATVGASSWPSAVANTPGRLNVPNNGAFTEGSTALNTFGTWSDKIPFRIEAYGSAAGDLTHATNTTRPTHTWSTTAGAAWTNFGAYVHAFSIDFIVSSTNTGVSGFIINNGHNSFNNCRWASTSANSHTVLATTGNAVIFTRCKMTKNASGAHTVVSGTGSGYTFDGCEIVGAANDTSQVACISSSQSSNAGLIVERCILRNARYGISLSHTGVGRVIVRNNVFYGLATAGITGSTDQAFDGAEIVYNIFQTCVTPMTHSAGAGPYAPLRYNYNILKSDTSEPLADGTSNAFVYSAPNNQSETGTLLTTPGSDFTIDSGSKAAATGFPGILYTGGAGYTGYLDAGALNRQTGGVTNVATGSPGLGVPEYRIKAGSTSERRLVYIQKAADSTPYTGLTYNSTGLVAYYVREDGGNNNANSITLAAGTRGTYTNSGAAGSGGGFKEVDATNLPGWYEFSIPDAVLDSANACAWAVITLKGVTGMFNAQLRIDMTDYDPQGMLADMSTTFDSRFTANCTTSSALVTAILDADRSTHTTASTQGQTLNALAGGTSPFVKNTAYNNYTFGMYDSTTGALKTGVTVTATRSIDGAAFGACANAVSEIGSTGTYKINLASSDLNGDKITLLFTGTGAICPPKHIKTQAVG